MPAFVSALPDVGRAAYGLINVGRRGRGYGEITQCRGECWSDGEAAWSPGRDRIAFSRVTGPRSAPGPSRVAIDVANADGGLADEIDAARAEAVKGLRRLWLLLGRDWLRLGITGQAAQQRWG